MVVINLSDKFAYVFVALGILLFMIIIVGAVAPNPGHDYNQVNISPITVDRTNNRIGIGMSTPAATLDVSGTFRSTSATIAGGTLFAQGGTLRVSALSGCDTVDTDFSGNFVCGTDASGSGGLSGTGNANFLTMFTGASNVANSAVYQNAQWNIGIGTTTPSEKLDVVGNIKSSGNVQSGTFSTGGGWFYGTTELTMGSANNHMDFWRGGGIGYGRISVGSLRTVAGTDTSPYDTGEILLGGPIKPSVAGGDVIIQLG